MQTATLTLALTRQLSKTVKNKVSQPDIYQRVTGGLIGRRFEASTAPFASGTATHVDQRVIYLIDVLCGIIARS